MDWNEDGLKDLIVGENPGTVRYYRNTGTVGNPSLTFDSYLQVGGVNIDVGYYSQPWVDDWNEDGKKDLLIGASDGRAYLYINVNTNEEPRFDETQWVTLATGAQLDFGSRSGPVVADFNGDGVKDVLSGGYDGHISYCQNNGTNANPRLANPVSLCIGSNTIDVGATSRIAIWDWNEDGDMDVLSGVYECRLKLYLQTATTEPLPTVEINNLGGFTIPGSGGTLNFSFSADNSSGSTAIIDAWTEAESPDESYYGPLLLRTDISLGPYSSISRTLSQYVPGGAPSGIYYYHGYTGNFDDLQIYSSDDFAFNKLSYEDGCLDNWEVMGWMDDDLCQPTMQLPDRVSLVASPNPFNPATTLQFALESAEQVNVSVYNTGGALVATLADGYRQAGIHEVTFDATDLPSGVYFARLTFAGQSQVQKLMLIK